MALTDGIEGLKIRPHTVGLAINEVVAKYA